MPESVEAAWEEFWRLHDWGEDGGEALVNVAVRAAERTRLLNPSDELVEAVAKAMCVISPLRQWRTDRSWDTAGESVRDSYRVLARAALQAAAKEDETERTYA